MAKTYTGQQAAKQQAMAEKIDRMSRMPTRVKKVTAEEMAAAKKGWKR